MRSSSWLKVAAADMPEAEEAATAVAVETVAAVVVAKVRGASVAAAVDPRTRPPEKPDPKPFVVLRASKGF